MEKIYMEDINEEDNRNNKKKTIGTIITCLVLVAIVGIATAYFFNRKSGNLGTVTVGNMSLTFANGDNSLTTSGRPIYDEDVASQASFIIFSVKNTGNIPMYTEISFQNITMDVPEFKSYDMKWSLEEGSGIASDDYYSGVTKVAAGNFQNIDESDSTNKNLIMTRNILIQPNQTKYYRVRVWLSENGGDQSVLSGKSFNTKIGAKGYAKAQKVKLADAILTNNISQLVQENNAYYFTGSNPNNNIVIKDGIKVQENASAEDGSTIPAKDPYYIDLEAVILGVNSNNTVVILDKDAWSNCGPYNNPIAANYHTYNISNYTTTASEILFDSNTMLKSGWTSSNPNASYICNKTSIDGLYECIHNEFNGSVANYHSTFTLKTDIYVTGSGTEEDPYVIE